MAKPLGHARGRTLTKETVSLPPVRLSQQLNPEALRSAAHAVEGLSQLRDPEQKVQALGDIAERVA